LSREVAVRLYVVIRFDDVFSRGLLVGTGPDKLIINTSVISSLQLCSANISFSIAARREAKTLNIIISELQTAKQEGFTSNHNVLIQHYPLCYFESEHLSFVHNI